MNKMENELFVPYRQSLDLRELGFDEPCFGIFYGEDLSTDFDPDHHDINLKCPIYQQAFRWFRKKHQLEASIQRMPPEIYGKGKGNIKNYLMYIWAENLNPRGQQTLHFDTYEEAELECIKKLIEIVKDKNEQNE
jgi:hypothetical protein